MAYIQVTHYFLQEYVKYVFHSNSITSPVNFNVVPAALKTDLRLFYINLQFVNVYDNAFKPYPGNRPSKRQDNLKKKIIFSAFKLFRRDIRT